MPRATTTASISAANNVEANSPYSSSSDPVDVDPVDPVNNVDNVPDLDTVTDASKVTPPPVKEKKERRKPAPRPNIPVPIYKEFLRGKLLKNDTTTLLILAQSAKLLSALPLSAQEASILTEEEKNEMVTKYEEEKDKEKKKAVTDSLVTCYPLITTELTAESVSALKCNVRLTKEQKPETVSLVSLDSLDSLVA